LIRSAGRAPGQCELRRGQDVPSFPLYPSRNLVKNAAGL
jgi:hypothetical protein